jgi:PAS domain S-box-containing protein
LKNSPQNWQQTLRQWFLDPLAPLDDRDSYHRAQALAALALSVFVIAIGMTLAFYVTSPNNQFLRVNILAVLTVLFTYGLARTHYQRTATWVLLLVCSIPILYTAAPNPDTAYAELIGLAYLVIPLLIAGLLLPLASLVAFSVIVLASILAAPLLYDGVTQDANLIEPFGIVGSTAAMLVLMRLLRAGYLVDGDNQQTTWQSLHDFAPLGVIVYQAGVIVKINPSGMKMFGASDVDEVIGQPITDFFDQNLNRESESVRRFEYKDSYALEMRELLHRLDGTTRDTMIISTPVIHQQRLATQIIVTDLTAHSDAEARLKELESNYANIRQVVMDYAYEAEYRDRKFIVVWLSDTFTQLTGYTQAEINRSGYALFVHPDDLYKVEAGRQQLMKGQTATVEFRLMTKAGETLWIRDYQSPIYDKNKQNLVGVSGIAQDITQRIESEHLLREYALQQAVIAELGQRALNPAERVSDLLQEAATLAVQVLDAEYGLIVEVDEAQTSMNLRASVGWQDKVLPDSMRIANSNTQTAYTIRRKETIVTSNYGADPRFKSEPTYETYGIRSGVSVLIAVQQRILGVIAVHTTELRNFTLEDVNFLQAIANLLAALLEQHRIRQAENEQRVLAEALRDTAEMLNSTLELEKVLQRMLTNLSSVLPHDAAVIMLIEDDKARAIKQSGFEKYQDNFNDIFDMEFEISDLFRDMISAMQPVSIPDVSQDPRWISIEGTEWIRSYIGAPIQYQGRLLGIINVYGTTVGRFDKTQEQRLMAFADQASIAIRNANHAYELEQTVAQRTHELEVERKTIQTILESTGEGIFYTIDGFIRYANETLCAMVGYTQRKLEGRHVRFLLAEDAEIQPDLWENLRAHINMQNVWRGESLLRRCGGSTFDAGLTLSLGSDGQSVVTLVRDISQFKLLEAQKARFIATASHELRSPISALNTRLYMMKHNPEDMPQHITLMRDTIERLNRLVEDLLDISRFEKGVIQLRRVHLILQEVVQYEFDLQSIEAEHQDIRFEHQMAETPFSIFADPDRLSQVLTNLISNAFKHTEVGGRVIVKVYAQAEEAYIAVQDNGAGIASEDLPHVFDPFFQGGEAKDGAGLGLSISQEIIHLHGGEITVESVLGEGSTFTVCLPLGTPDA